MVEHFDRIDDAGLRIEHLREPHDLVGWIIGRQIRIGRQGFIELLNRLDTEGAEHIGADRGIQLFQLDRVELVVYPHLGDIRFLAN